MDDYKWDSGAGPDEDGDTIDSEIAAAVEDAYLHPETDLDAYLSLEDYEQQADAEMPVQRRGARAEKSSGNLRGFLKGLSRQEERGRRTGAAPDYAAGLDERYAPDGDLSAPEEESADYDYTDAELSDHTDPRIPVHGGSVGKAEAEARELIASLQAESGAVRRDKRTASEYRLELDDLLSIPGEEEVSAEDTAAEASDDYFEPEPDLLLEDLAPDAATGAHSRPPRYSSDRGQPEIDSRFNLSGIDSRRTVSFGDREVDLGPDSDYAPARQSGYSPSQWTSAYDDPLAKREEEKEPERKKHRFLFGKKRQDAESTAAEHEAAAPPKKDAVEIRDSAASPVIYAADEDYAEAPAYTPAREESEAPDNLDDQDFDEMDYEGFDDDRSRKYRESDLYVPPTFREYLLSIIASVWLRLRGTVRGRTAETMPDTEEDLGPELSPAEASRYYGSFIRSMKLRLRISAVVLLMLAYISLEMPIPGKMQSLPVAAAYCFGMQAVIMLLALDVVTGGLTNLFRLRFSAAGLAVISCLFTGIDALIVALTDVSALHMPLCAVSSASVVGLLLASYLSAKGLRKATRVPAIGKNFFAVTGENTLEPGEITLLKSRRGASGFVRRTEEAGPDETLYARIAPLLFAAAFLMAVIVTIVKKSYPEFIYILSAMLVLTVPFGAMLSFSLPFFLGSVRIFKFGAAIAGWSGLCDIGASKNLILTDRDLFPESAVSIDTVRIFADEDAQKVISYAGSMMSASGACSAGCFEELMRQTDSPARHIDGFEVLPGGGMKGIIEGHLVLCGSSDLMHLMNVRIPFRLTDKTTVLLAIDGILYGIFTLKYEGQPQIRKALTDLVRTARPPVFAVRDFNVNPEMLHNTFDLATDGYDFPPFVERFRLSEPSEDAGDERIAAILCNEGLPPLTSVASIGRSMYLATNINVIINLIAAIFGMLLVFFRFLTSGTNSLATLFLYMFVWALPVLLVSFSVNIKR